MNSDVERPINSGLLLAAMIVLALCLMWPTLNMGLWLDELCSVNDVSYSSLQGVIANMWGRMDDLHPPLYQIYLYPFIKYFGISDYVVRTPPIICGLLTLPSVYWLGKLAHSKWVGLLAVFFAACSPYFNYFSCQSRGYALGTLLATWTLISFIKLTDSSAQKKFPALPFAATVLSASAFCYTEYIGIFMLASLGLASVWRYFAMRGSAEQNGAALRMFVLSSSALVLAFLLFAPWIPSMMMQSHSMNDLQELAPRYEWPRIFSFNLMMMFPLPLLFSIPVYCVGVLVFIIYAGLNRKKLPKPKYILLNTPRTTAILLCAVVVPSSFIGFVTPWFIGYFRHIYPYTAAGWVLLAMLLHKLLGHSRNIDTADSAQHSEATIETVGNKKLSNNQPSDKQSSDNQPSDTQYSDSKLTSKKPSSRRLTTNQRRALLFAILTIVFALNMLQIYVFDSRPQSGFRTFAKAVRSGELDNSVVLVVPDVIVPTFNYYFPAQEREKHNIKCAGFPRWADPYPIISIADLAALWGPESIVEHALKQIDALPSQGYKYLVVAKDSDKQIASLSTKTTPRAARVQSLLAQIKQKYKLKSETHYPGATEDVTTLIYELPSQK